MTRVVAADPLSIHRQEVFLGEIRTPGEVTPQIVPVAQYRANKEWYEHIRLGSDLLECHWGCGVNRLTDECFEEECHIGEYRGLKGLQTDPLVAQDSVTSLLQGYLRKNACFSDGLLMIGTGVWVNAKRIGGWISRDLDFFDYADDFGIWQKINPGKEVFITISNGAAYGYSRRQVRVI